MEPTPGKLKNISTSEELPFAVNPTEYRLARAFDYAVEPCLGQPAPVVAYRSGGASELTFQLLYDHDVDKNLDVKKLHTFLRNAGKVQADTKSTPVIEFALGSFLFRGFLRQLVFLPYRFDAQGNPTGARVDLSLLSNGEYENGKS